MAYTIEMEMLREKIHFRYSDEKNAILKRTRGICFEEVKVAIEENKVLDIIDHPNKEKYPNQKMYVLDINCYVYLVPFVRNGNEVFLKTIIPNRKAFKKYRHLPEGRTKYEKNQ